MPLPINESIVYNGMNNDEVIEWAKNHGEHLLVMFNGKPTFFFPAHRMPLIPGDKLIYNTEFNLVQVVVKKLWYNKIVKNS